MINRWMAVVLGAAMLAVPGTALAKNDHAKGPKHQKAEKVHGKSHKHGKKDKAAKPKTFVFKGLYKGAGVVTVAKGNGRVRKGGFVGQDVTFDMSAAKLVVADTDGVPGVTVDDLQVGDEVLVQAKLPRGTEAPSAVTARKVIDKTHPPVSADDDQKTEDHGADDVSHDVDDDHGSDD